MKLKRKSAIFREMYKKYQVFISSTYKDLINEREQVRDTILSMYQFPIGMEMFSAANEEQWEIIKETIDSSDYYILIIGKRYGSVIEDGPDAGMSYTEKEYRYAKRIGLPILAYIKKDEVITANNVDTDPEKVKKLQTFKDDVTKGREVKWFSSTEELGKEVSLSLHKEIDRGKRPGWIRSDSVDIEKSLSEIVELSRQNRGLQEENKRLSIALEKCRGAYDRRPNLDITLASTKADDDEHQDFYNRDEIILIEEDGVVHLKQKTISTEKEMSKFLPISWRDIPPDIKNRINELDIKNYNAELPSKDEVEKYLQSYITYLRIMENGVPITIFVNNLGTSKATDVSVTIEFPDAVRVFDLDDIIGMPKPEAPKLPKNPINEAYKRLNQERSHALNIPLFSDWGGINNSSYISPIAYSPFRNGNTIYSYIEIEDNIVEIGQTQGIVHTKSDYFTGAYVVPFCKGEYEAKITLMCAEYQDPEETTIKLVVE